MFAFSIIMVKFLMYCLPSLLTLSHTPSLFTILVSTPSLEI